MLRRATVGAEAIERVEHPEQVSVLAARGVDVVRRARELANTERGRRELAQRRPLRLPAEEPRLDEARDVILQPQRLVRARHDGGERQPVVGDDLHVGAVFPRRDGNPQVIEGPIVS